MTYLEMYLISCVVVFLGQCIYANGLVQSEDVNLPPIMRNAAVIALVGLTSFFWPLHGIYVYVRQR